MTETHGGIEYTKPQVFLLQETGLGVAEFAARTCYDSFEASENEAVRDANDYFSQDNRDESEVEVLKVALNRVESSDLLDSLAWTHFHHSILEHANLSFLVRGTSRGVLQEHARHRIQAISVRSTRYTMSDVIYAYMCSYVCGTPIAGYDWFEQKMLSFDMFVTCDPQYNKIEVRSIWEKLDYNSRNEDNFKEISLARQNLEIYMQSDTDEYFGQPDKLFEALRQNKKKRNVGDAFKHIVSDNWKVDMVVTFNLRSLKNYFSLRDSGAAYFQIQWLAQEMKKSTPNKYLDLIVKEKI